jgi:hypothetical protein
MEAIQKTKNRTALSSINMTPTMEILEGMKVRL